VRLSSFRSRVVLVNFWATWCAPCKVETPWLIEMSNHYRARGLEVLGVSMDDGGQDRIRAFAAEHHVTYPILIGNAGVADAYGGVRFLPQTFFIGRDGRIIARTFGMRTREDLERDVKLALELH
jgi:thiol-disulfide isomerase/thioredoxin